MDLVILAAGMGSRFGGDKQTQPIDKEGNFILDYSVYDAVRAGFDRIILIIREEHKNIFEETVCKRLKKIVPVSFAFQNMNDVPKNAIIPKDRTKPWGTAHALYACKDIVSDRFAVINADDFYGFDSFKVVADFLKHSSYDEFVSVGFNADSTIPNKGVFKRGIFKLDKDKAVELVESKVEKKDGKIFATPLNEENWHEISPNTMVSMTMFGFSKKIFVQIEKEMKNFFSQSEDFLKTNEILLPAIVGDMLNKTITMKVLPTKSKWFGITYREDLDVIKNAIQTMKNNSEYPKSLNR